MIQPRLAFSVVLIGSAWGELNTAFILDVNAVFNFYAILHSRPNAGHKKARTGRAKRGSDAEEALLAMGPIDVSAGRAASAPGKRL